MAEGIFPEIALGTHLNPCSTLQIYILKLVVDLKQQRSANYTNYEMNFKAEKILDRNMNTILKMDFNSCLCNPWFLGTLLRLIIMLWAMSFTAHMRGESEGSGVKG